MPRSCIRLDIEFFDLIGSPKSRIPVILCQEEAYDEETFGLNRVIIGRLDENDMKRLPHIIPYYDSEGRSTLMTPDDYARKFGIFVYRDMWPWFAYTGINTLLVGRRQLTLYLQRPRYLTIINTSSLGGKVYVEDNELEYNGVYEVLVEYLPIKVTMGGMISFVIYRKQ